ncbi:S-adenosylmethionine decarboxylase proenzyme [Halotydeus destructor]|nr:S-adenosylmethionine decarboxylase proenzyme [Halotydeus destructor]
MNVQANYSGFFEGAEKLLEVWFANASDEEPVVAGDLRLVPRNAWDSILKLVKCEVISFKSNEGLDSYVLSESSMFVSRNRFIIKTCGSTCLLNCLEPLLYVAKEVAGFDDVLDVFYSRKNFVRPEMQPEPHSNFDSEVKLLDSFFEDGAAYCLGRVNRDHWYFYTLSPATPAYGVTAPDQTLEVIMQNLDAKAMQIFHQEFSGSGVEATMKSGIDKLIPGAIIDEFLFEPCGYSMNAYIKGGYYMTMHITPEAGFSYVSFETNVPLNSYRDLVIKLLKAFNPGNFILTLLSNEASVAGTNKADWHFLDYKQNEMQICRINNYELTYGQFAKAPS